MTKPKRKVDCNIEAKEPVSKVAKTDATIYQNHTKTSMQNMKKAELLQYCKELEDINNKLEDKIDVLVKEKEDNIDTIDRLEETVKVLELKNSVLQQDEEKFKYTCSDCDYESDCVHCFSDHDHDPEEANEREIKNFNCYYCDEIFPSKATVMRHTKISHMDKAQHCLNFLEGSCRYSENCWFLHDDDFKKSEPTFTCKYCDERFKTKTQLMHHKKTNHIEKVVRCTNENENCKYGSENCWFLHNKKIE